MFRLPVCPHCKTVYHYKETRKAVREKNFVCYHCKKKIRATLIPGIFVLGAIIVTLSILTNLLMLSSMTYLNLILLFVSTFLYLGLLYILIPFFASFKGDNTEQSRLKTNNKRKQR